MTTPDTLMDLVRQTVPPNIVQATMQQYRTSLVYPGDQDNVRTDLGWGELLPDCCQRKQKKCILVE